ncbi:hypothetical protein F5Y18DRAFT_424157 [Xylariaceae sp. FL1019]|nr:hypothetical protein F5Y18DRAFT_424157 [Xylariaceae sp. FL1019]
MLCQICHQSLEMLHDPSKTNRLGLRSDILSCDPFFDSDKDRLRWPELEQYVFGHHKTLASFQDSIDRNCIICNRFGSTEIDNNQPYEHLGYFSLFTLSLDSGRNRLSMAVHYGNYIVGGSYLVPCLENDVEPTRMLPESTKDEKTWTLIRTWLKRCDEEHTLCQPCPDHTMPNWLLELRSPPMANAAVRLVQGSTLSPDTPYMTLSHCGELEGRTLLSDSERHKFHDWQPLTQLPNLYLESCEATSRAGGSHLWIEDLCSYGPERLSSPLVLAARRTQRTAAFRGATLAIAALSTRDSLFASRKPADMVATIVNLPIGPNYTPVPHVFEFERSWSWMRTLQGEPLLKSPQLVMDRLLAPRMLLFGSEQVFWECGLACTCEMHPDPCSTAMAARTARRGGGVVGGHDGTKRLFKPTLDMSFYRESKVAWRQILLDWYRVIEVYSAKDFDHENDGNRGILASKVNGLTDIATLVRNAVASEGFSSLGRYIAGHWEGTLPESLAWSAKRPGHRSVATLVPSWSWASIDTPVTFLVSASESSQAISLLKLETVRAGSDHGGSENITILGRLARAALLPPENQDEEQITVGGKGFRILASLESEHNSVHNKDRTANWGCVFDTMEDICDEFFVMPMTVVFNTSYRSVSLLALVRVPACSADASAYRRVGMVTIEGSETDYSEADHSAVVAFINEQVERRLHLQ